ncbi:MAG: thioredoxin, partial [Phycisphaerales bacterium]|nr:thioredoxin [Phycisphaerales bacterium]
GKVNVDDEAELASKFGIASIPTVLVFKNGKVTDTLIGIRPRADYERALLG